MHVSKDARYNLETLQTSTDKKLTRYTLDIPKATFSRYASDNQPY